MTPDRIAKALKKLIAQGEGVIATTQHILYEPEMVDQALATEWAVNSVALLRSAFGDHSVHYTAVQDVMGSSGAGGAARSKNQFHRFRADVAQGLLGTLRGALVAWRNGYVFSIQDLVRADVETSLIDQAAELLAASHTLAAAVVAGAVLEQHLRAIAPSWGVSLTDSKGNPRTLGPLNDELKKANAYDGIMQKRITLSAGIRNEAAHGRPFTSREADVKAMIGDVLRICGDVRAK